jgi:hypothetical protein
MKLLAVATPVLLATTAFAATPVTAIEPLAFFSLSAVKAEEFSEKLKRAC